MASVPSSPSIISGYLTLPCSFSQYCLRQRRYRKCHLLVRIPIDSTPPPNPLCPHHKLHPELTEGNINPKQKRSDKNKSSNKQSCSKCNHTHSVNSNDYSLDPTKIPPYILQFLNSLLASDLIRYPRPQCKMLHSHFSTLFPPPHNPLRQKHLLQESSLIQNMSANGLLSALLIPDFHHAIIELGAGTGGFSRHIHRTIVEMSPANYLGAMYNYHLVDHTAFRSRVRYDHELIRLGAQVTRHVRDITGLSVSKMLPDFNPANLTITFVTKHLCGSATDLALLMVRDSIVAYHISVCMAPCCHSLCDWETYVGKSFLERAVLERATVHNPPEVFAWLAKLSSWATLDKDDDEDDYDQENQVPLFTNSLLASRNHRRKLGHVCKHIIDSGRAEFLKAECGFDAFECVEYTEASTENGCLIGWKKTNKE